MSKYGDLIKEARKTDNSAEAEQNALMEDSVKQEKENSIILENKKTSIPETKKSPIIEKKKTSIPERKNSSIVENKKAGMTKIEDEKLAGISIKVPENLRRHWVVESKRKGKSMTSVIIEALTEEFGTPNDDL